MATDDFSILAAGQQADWFPTALCSDLGPGAFSMVVVGMTSSCWFTGAVSLVLCCGWLMIKTFDIFYRKVYLSPLRGLRDERTLIQWYLNLLVITMAFIYQCSWIAKRFLGFDFFVDGVHIRPRAATMQGGWFVAVFLGFFLLVRLCTTFLTL